MLGKSMSTLMPSEVSTSPSSRTLRTRSAALAGSVGLGPALDDQLAGGL